MVNSKSHVIRYTSHLTPHLIKLPLLMDVCSVGKEKVKPRAKVSACARSAPTVTKRCEYHGAALNNAGLGNIW